jgi:hypothetical protein
MLASNKVDLVHQFYRKNSKNKPMEVSKRNKGGGGVVTTQKQCKKKF